MPSYIPKEFILIFSSAQIAERTRELGASICEWAEKAQKETGRDVLAVPVLRGAIFFFADLVRSISNSIEIAPVRTWGYEQNELKAAMEVNLEGARPEGRTILLVDDICDTGRSLHAVEDAFIAAGAHEVESVVLIRRMISSPAHVPRWTGFNFEKDSWFVGYGMDDSERWRNLPDIYVIPPSPCLGGASPEGADGGS